MKNVWAFAFECSGVAKVGGLAEAVSNALKQLSERGFHVTLFMPSHGVHKNTETRKKLQLEKIPMVIRGKLKEKCFIPYREPYRYKIAAWKGKLKGFNLILFSGLNEASSEILDDKTVYRAKRIEDKAVLLARGTEGFIANLEKTETPAPDIIHAHDWHAFPAAILAKQRLEKLGRKPAFVITIHLLSRPKTSWRYLGEKWCGIKNEVHPVFIDGERKLLSHKELLKKAKRRIEAFAALEAHIVTSVSKSYLEEEVIPFVGSACKCKKMHIWNGCDWNYKQMLKKVAEKFGENVKETLKTTEIRRYHLRRYFLTKAIGNLEPEEPFLDEGIVKETVWNFTKKPFLGKGKVEPFAEDGPMVLMTGRLAKQKGVDTLFKAIPKILREIPETKFVLLFLPLPEEKRLIEKSAKIAMKYKESVRVIFGKAPSIYILAHLSSDVFVCPSLWEPFGIMALEAMATGNPVIATQVGGLSDTVVDIRQKPETATGILIPAKDFESLTEAAVSLITALMIAERTEREGQLRKKELHDLAKHISFKPLKKRVLNQPTYGSKLRENAIHRVEKHFRWNKIINMLIDAYEKAVNIAEAS